LCSGSTPAGATKTTVMLHHKSFNSIEGALIFANTHGVMPVSFYSSPTDSHPVNNRVCMVYEAVEIPEPNTHIIDKLHKATNLLREIKACGYTIYKPLEDKIEECLSSL